jgi:hypothetical protein
MLQHGARSSAAAPKSSPKLRTFGTVSLAPALTCANDKNNRTTEQQNDNQGARPPARAAGEFHCEGEGGAARRSPPV